jgi:hypothetical protein
VGDFALPIAYPGPIDHWILGWRRVHGVSWFGQKTSFVFDRYKLLTIPVDNSVD